MLAAAAHATIAATSGYGTPHAWITLAVAAGTVAGAIALGAAWRSQRAALTITLSVALLAGEAFGMLSTGERLIVGRETTQGPLRVAARARANAFERVQVAEAALAAAPSTSRRLADALLSKSAAERAVNEKASERGCAGHCRALLEGQVAAASTEVEAARRELAELKASKMAEQAVARLVLAAAPALPSASPFADRLGVPAWALDLAMASLGSLSVNLLAIGLIAFGAHQRHPALSSSVEILEPSAIPAAISGHSETLERPMKRLAPIIDVGQHAARFAVARLEPAEKGQTKIADLWRAYRAWCADEGHAPLPDAEIAEALVALFRTAGLAWIRVDGEPAVAGVALKRCPPSPTALNVIADGGIRGPKHRA